MTLFDAPPRIATSARISACGRYRYDLQRRWEAGPLLTFVMLNPSIADDRLDDATTRRCMGFAGREGLSGIRLVNLFAARAKKPRDLAQFDDPVGSDNDAWITTAIEESEMVVCAWGATVLPKSLPPIGWQVARVLHACSRFGRIPTCLGTTQSGQPRHPLYIRADQPLEVWA